MIEMIPLQIDLLTEELKSKIYVCRDISLRYAYSPWAKVISKSTPHKFSKNAIKTTIKSIFSWILNFRFYCEESEWNTNCKYKTTHRITELKTKLGNSLIFVYKLVFKFKNIKIKTLK